MSPGTVESTVAGSDSAAVPLPPAETAISIGRRTLATRYFLAPLAGYTHLAFRRAIRACGGVGLATTDLVQAAHLVSGTRWARQLVATHPEDDPLSVQIYGGMTAQLVKAAQWLEAHGYAAIDINMGCPMAKITGQGGGARLMCDTDGACRLVGAVVQAVSIPVTVKMRLGWDRDQISAPALAREFEQLGVAAITIHGRTRAQGFRGTVDLEGIRAVVESVQSIPVIGNGDVRTVADAWRMRAVTGCAAIAIGRGALIDPWIFRRLELAQATAGVAEAPVFQPSPAEQVEFLSRHFQYMVDQHGEFQSCRMYRKFAAWFGATLGIPEDLEDRLRRFESIAEFEQIVVAVRERQGTRLDPRATWEIKVPNGPVEYW
ncbi:MAG: tRNA-dihydrouridine synthase [Planctomycetes bacterium]|nr:tRNA-dihydrouridine synthase [Planctomycetota bacterium]